MILNADAVKALDKKDEAALVVALRKEYGDAAEYLAGKLLGKIKDDNVIQ